MKPPPRYRLAPSSRGLTRRRDALLRRLRETAPFIDGSPVLIARTCGNSAHCRCSRGAKHVSTYLTYAVQGKTHTIYIPVDLEKDVRRWSATYKKMKQLIREICDVQKTLIRQHVAERRRR